MARQSTTPVSFNQSLRQDKNVTMTSGRAGVVVPVAFMPILRGDSASGRIGIDIELAEMPRPLLNGVMANMQAWFVPKAAHPQFGGSDDFMHSFTGEVIKKLGDVDRLPAPFFNVLNAGERAMARDSELFKTLGLHVGDRSVNTDLIDAFNLVYNFRLAAHSSRLTRREYAIENLENSVKLPPAFWPMGRFSHIVPDYERALVVGELAFDVESGRVPLRGFYRVGVEPPTGVAPTNDDDPYIARTAARALHSDINKFGGDELYAELDQQTIVMTLADIDKARVTQAFAKLRTAYAGNDATGFANDDAIIATLMSGYEVPEDHYKRPWMLDSKMVTFGFGERFATDAANLDVSVSQGRASGVLSLNLPKVDTGGIIIVTVEVLPERIDERQSDEFMHVEAPADLPDALRDVQRTEPVDIVLNQRIDNAHNNRGLLYGYEPMNKVWDRDTVRLGGVFYQPDPTQPAVEQRSGIWQAGIIDPEFSEHHWLAPVDFPHDVFSDTEAPAFEIVSRHSLTIKGLTQMGDVLDEDNAEFREVAETEPSDGTFLG